MYFLGFYVEVSYLNCIFNFVLQTNQRQPRSASQWPARLIARERRTAIFGQRRFNRSPLCRTHPSDSTTQIRIQRPSGTKRILPISCDTRAHVPLAVLRSGRCDILHSLDIQGGRFHPWSKRLCHYHWFVLLPVFDCRTLLEETFWQKGLTTHLRIRNGCVSIGSWCLLLHTQRKS